MEASPGLVIKRYLSEYDERKSPIVRDSYDISCAPSFRKIPEVISAEEAFHTLESIPPVPVIPKVVPMESEPMIFQEKLDSETRRKSDVCSISEDSGFGFLNGSGRSGLVFKTLPLSKKSGMISIPPGAIVPL